MTARKPPLEATDQYRNEPMAMAAHPDATFEVQIRHADRETFQAAREWNERVGGMAALAVRNDADDLLLVDHDAYGGWVIPGGRVDGGESFRAAAVRETREESGVAARVVRPLAIYHFVNRYDGDSTDSYLVQFEGKALDTDPAEDPGEADEPITDVGWFSTLPNQLSDDRFVERTTRTVAARFGCAT